MEYNEEINTRIASLAASACLDLFDAYDVHLEPATRSWTDSGERLLCGTVGFVGRGVRGSCLVAGEERPLTASCPPGGRLGDWVGELANQLAGRIKTRLLERGVEVSLTTPIVISGVHLEPLPRGRLEPAVFASGVGDVMVWAEVETAADFAFAVEQVSVRTGEGDVLLF